MALDSAPDHRYFKSFLECPLPSLHWKAPKTQQSLHAPKPRAGFRSLSPLYSCFWGSTYLGIRIAIESFPPLAMAGIRHMLVGLILYPILRWKTRIRPIAANWRTACVTGVLLLCVSNGALSWAELRVPSGIAALLVATVALWLVIVDWLRPGGTRPVPRVFVGLIMGFSGLALLIGPSSLGGARRADLLGTAVLLTASFIWACASLYSKHRPMPASPLLVVAMQSLAGGAALCIAALASGEFRALHFAAISTRSWLALLYLIVFGSGIGFTAYLYILKKSAAAKVATYGFVNPVVALSSAGRWPRKPLPRARSLPPP